MATSKNILRSIIKFWRWNTEFEPTRAFFR
jgi:hypothetical protein